MHRHTYSTDPPTRMPTRPANTFENRLKPILYTQRHPILHTPTHPAFHTTPSGLQYNNISESL